MSKFQEHCQRFNRIADAMRRCGYYSNMGPVWCNTHRKGESAWALASMREDGTLRFADIEDEGARVSFKTLAQAEEFILRKTAEKLCDHIAVHNKNLTKEQFGLVCDLKSALDMVEAKR